MRSTFTDWRLWFVAPAILALATVVLFPTVYLFWMSVTHWVVTDPETYFGSAENFQQLFGATDFWRAARVTLVYLILSSGLMVFFALGLALVLSEQRSAGIFRALVVMPLVIPPVVAAFTWRFLLNSETGFIGAFLLPSVGFTTSLLADPVGALFSVVIADVWSRTPFMFLIFLAALQSIPADYYEAARIDGASILQQFFFITLPMMTGAIVIALLFRVIDAINTFELIYVMTKGGPGRATQTLSLLGWKTAFQGFDLGGAAALGVVMLVITLICAQLTFNRFLRSPGMTRTVTPIAESPPRPRSVQILRTAFLIGALVFVLFPLMWLALGSLKTRNEALALPPRIIFDPTFEAYSKIVAGGFIRAFGNSLTIALSNVALALAIGTPAAFALTRMRGRISNDLSFWILTIRMAPLFAVILPLYVLFKSVGLLDTKLAVALAHLTLTLPLAIWMLMTYFRSMPIELDQAAMIDGASPLQILWHIIVPISRPMLASVAIVVFIFSWNEFLLAFVLSARDAQTVPVAVAGLAGTMTFDWPLIAAISVCSMIPAFVFVGIAQRHIVTGLASGAVK